MAEQKKSEKQAHSAPATAEELAARLPSAAENLNPIIVDPLELMELLDDVHGICEGLVGDGCPMEVDLEHIFAQPLRMNVVLNDYAKEGLNAREFLALNYGTIKAAVSIAGIVSRHAARFVEDCACHIGECELTLQKFKE